MDDPILEAIASMDLALKLRPDAHWVIGFSGGKDSTAALKVFLSSYRRAKIRPSKVTLIYCDTGVENQVLDIYVKNLIGELRDEFRELGWPIDCAILKAPIHDRFFVKIVGRGYPPPTNSFRWCTTGLRIRPVSRFIANQDPDNTVVVLGLRSSESQQRDRSLSRSSAAQWQKQREGAGDYDIFLPVLNLDISAVWDVVFALPFPVSLDSRRLEHLYRDASGECPIVKSPQAAPCASGRFGCWTCTVVRKDKSAAKLIDAGYSELKPFLEFRDWLAHIRNDSSRRWSSRRSGAQGLGPFTLDARKEILKKVDELEDRTGSMIIDGEERGVIASLWQLDHIPRLKHPD